MKALIDTSAHFHWIAHHGIRYLKRYTYIWEWTRLFQIPEVTFLVAQGTHVENGAICFTYLLSVQRKMVSIRYHIQIHKPYKCKIWEFHVTVQFLESIPFSVFHMNSMRQIYMYAANSQIFLLAFPNSAQPYGMCLQLSVQTLNTLALQESLTGLVLKIIHSHLSIWVNVLLPCQLYIVARSIIT